MGEKKGFSEPVFIGRGAMLHPETRSYTPFHYDHGKQVLEPVRPYPAPGREHEVLLPMKARPGSAGGR